MLIVKTRSEAEKIATDALVGCDKGTLLSVLKVLSDAGCLTPGLKLADHYTTERPRSAGMGQEDSNDEFHFQD
jgi:hypothetical protein